MSLEPSGSWLVWQVSGKSTLLHPLHSQQPDDLAESPVVVRLLLTFSLFAMDVKFCLSQKIISIPFYSDYLDNEL